MNKFEKYSSYKDSGVEWLGEIPEHWEIMKTTHVFNKIGSGTTPTSTDTKYYDGEINWLQTGDLTDNIISETSKKITYKALKDFSTLKIYPKNSLVIAMYGATIGKAGILDIETATNQACCVLSNAKQILEKYAFYWFLASKNNIISMGYGGGQPNISQDLIKSLRITIPTRDEQTKIAFFLDEKTAQIDEVISQKEKLIELLKERKQIVINDAVTKGLDKDVEMMDSGVEWIGKIPKHWGILPLKACTKLKSIKNVPDLELLSVYLDLGVIRFKDVEQKRTNVTSIDLSDYQLVEKGDFVLNNQQAWRGSVGVSKYKGIISPAYIVLELSDKFNFIFANYYFRNKLTVSQYLINSKGVGTIQRNLYWGSLKQTYISIPPKNEQIKIVEYIENQTSKIDIAIELQQNYISKLKEYKASLIDSVVTGKVKVS
ncbi:restriction endonuclease subunit S [Aliarcobacter cryaerophilus]|uniref:restriction endonuclease subunit S n=1 Tax=Aliarcobacter cryaerophilus TaxID=28198 RepID=UPI003DA64967